MHDEEVAGGILATDVSGPKKAVPKSAGSGIGVVPLTEHHILARAQRVHHISGKKLMGSATRPNNLGGSFN
jgi:hypothetical protein